MARKNKKKNQKTSANGQPSKKERVSSRAKGEVVEKVVAMMHEGSGVQVHHDVMLPAKDDASRERQFDVLLVGNVAGYQTTIVIECKNYGRNINVKDVESFSGELEDVGLAPQQGILVSASKIGAGAQSRARSLGMRVFELKGLTADRLSSAIHEANQQVVFVVPYLSHLSVVSPSGRAMDNQETLSIFDEQGNLEGTLLDMIWLQWLHGGPPSVLGEHEYEFDTSGWHHLVNGELVPVWSVEVEVKVVGAVVLFSGTTTQHALVHPDGGGLHKYKQKAAFDIGPGQYPVEMVETEEELQQLLKKRSGALSVTLGRIRAPRLRLEAIYWPPSQRAVDKMRELHERHERDGEPELSPEALQGVEGTDLTVIWEPISEEYLTIKQPDSSVTASRSSSEDRGDRGEEPDAS
ncbi:MAG: restriction endonuclease [Rubrobacteraceae bacterium]